MTPDIPSREGFPDRPFTVADARAHGVTPKRLRASDLEAPFWGVRVKTSPTADGTPLSTPLRCRAFALRMPPYAVFSHLTAAQLHGLPLPFELREFPSLDVTVPDTERGIEAKHIRGHVHRLPATDVIELDGIRLTSVARTWCDLASLLDLRALVAAGDRIIHHTDARATRDELAHAVESHGQRWGSRALRVALPRLSDRAESPAESALRIMLVDAGFPEPLVNPEIPTVDGTYRVDLAYPVLSIGLEQEGDHHRTDRRQWRKDFARIRRLEAAGWSIIRFTAADLESPAGAFASLRNQIDSRIRSLTR